MQRDYILREDYLAVKKIYKFLSSNIRQVLEIIILMITVSVPFFLNLQELFKEYLDRNPLTPDNFIWHFAIKGGKYIAAAILFIIVLCSIRKINQEYIMNSKRVYHNYSYAWYWLCAKVLGIKKCNLVLVPIYMQFKLVINGTFHDYPLDETEYPVVENEPDSKVTQINWDNHNSEINLILEDTYVISERQIPKVKRRLKTIKVSRNNGDDRSGHFSQVFINKITNCVRGLEGGSIINVFATTNPMNTVHIAKRAFGSGERGNVKHLYVFQQGNSNKRIFKERGKKIF